MGWRHSLMRTARAILLCGLLSAATARSAEVDFVGQVQPILHKHCLSCHGALRQKSGLRLDHVSFMRAGGDRGPALAASGGESLLVQALLGGGDVERMPLEAKPLADEEIQIIKRWVDEGAKSPEQPLPDDPLKHWSFQPPVRVEPPAVARAEWNANPIDRFLVHGHEQRGLQPSPEAPRHVLLRRVYLDLIGLPPTPEELRAFVADPAPDAYEKVVDRLLASPQYGERWGRHWMDVWRYSDWDGYAAEVRESQPHIWRWRDWIIESLNADKPYDEMVREMLAADELRPTDANALRATGFLVRNWYRFNRNVWLEATVEHTSKAFLGITLNCARCHDHMYDPIEQTEYYQFRAVFEPHQVRTDRVAGQADVKLDGMARVYDAKIDEPTYLFQRGSEARPDKQHPLSPAVPRVLGGGLQLASVSLPVAAYYPGSQPMLRDEALAQAQNALQRCESSLAEATGTLAKAREQLKQFAAAKAAPAAAPVAPAGTTTPPATGAATKNVDAAMDEASLNAAARLAQERASLAEDELLAASAQVASVRARLAADDAALAVPPSANARLLAAEANRAQRTAESLKARHALRQLEHQLAEAKAKGDEVSKKQLAGLEKKLPEAQKAVEQAQAALATPGESYARFSDVYPATSTGRRAALARWITAPQNPLTARVAINHMWMRHFGNPLVPTVFDFGRNGKPPTHPQLLDYLATELTAGGWRMKPLHRLMVTSTAYRMSSAATLPANQAADPENVYMWRMNSRRMEAEVVRDSTLQVAGALDTTLYGHDLDQNTGLKVPRRSIYFRSSKEKKVVFLDTFDRANVTDCYRRAETIVPQQALALVNSSLSLAQARTLAGKLSEPIAWLSEADRPRAFVAAAFERVLCRPPSDEEAATCLEFLTTQAAKLADIQALAPFVAGEENPVKPSADPAQRARENLVHVLLNHNDFVTIH